MTTVPDASLFSQALIPSQRLAEASRALTELIQAQEMLVAPSLLAVEFRSTLRRLESRAVLRPETVQSIWGAFKDARVLLGFEIAWVERASEIAAAAGLSKVYDATYLACAEALDAELVTCDEKFAAALPPPLRSRVRLVAPDP